MCKHTSAYQYTCGRPPPRKEGGLFWWGISCHHRRATRRIQLDSTWHPKTDLHPGRSPHQSAILEGPSCIGHGRDGVPEPPLPPSDSSQRGKWCPMSKTTWTIEKCQRTSACANPYSVPSLPFATPAPFKKSYLAMVPLARAPWGCPPIQVIGPTAVSPWRTGNPSPHLRPLELRILTDTSAKLKQNVSLNS